MRTRSSEERRVTNVVIAGLGGQGVLKASDIVAEAAFRAGFDVKKSEIHGMSQRGGSVASDVRFGPEVFSPMVSAGEADFLVLLDADQLEANRAHLRPGGVLITPTVLAGVTLASRKSLNVALAGALSAWLDIPEETWLDAVRAQLPERLHAPNLSAFHAGRAEGEKQRNGVPS
jgi:indolepyruvate ferredoxin oxidoreductase, beta subunit